MGSDLPIVVYSHLRWDSVFQRPQQLMSRLARRRRILFIEEPVRGDRAEWELARPLENLRVACPRTPIAADGFDDEQIALMQKMLEELLTSERIGPHVAWLYTPLALPLARMAGPQLIVYDCMDELSAFAGAASTLPVREAKLLEVADLVFMGGPSLYRAKRHKNPYSHCFPSSVDIHHFRQARDPSFSSTEQAHLPSPRLGYFGVIDERIDIPLLRELATTRPDWQFVLVGPVAKISSDALPRGRNLHYLGPRPYADLPGLVAGWDVCLLPFAMNEATRFISPTKTLEYMAAEKPIVSTPIADVVNSYGRVVYVGAGAFAFAHCCEAALSWRQVKDSARLAAMRQIIACTSWDATVAKMERKLDRAAKRRSEWRDRVQSRSADRTGYAPRLATSSTEGPVS
jgi:UDP-galactopyranose mutase